ncbi:MAG: T9SS type A sorting domain-containing protein [Bacteroidetes bacterium]|nr:T9SS type A sorting domain-containing protein [Bacteroidota bacterium]
MKKVLLFSLTIIVGLAVTAQTFQLKDNIRTEKRVAEQKIGIEPVKFNATPVNPGPVMHQGDGINVVNVITIGTATNAYGYGYAGGQKTMVWADNDLGTIINLHRMGPDATIPGYSGYLGIDIGVNKAGTLADWTINQQIYASTLDVGGSYFLDAARYPQAVLFDPPGDGYDEAYCVYFAPNLSNDPGPWGGLSWGVSKLSDNSDSTKHLYYYNPPPYTYIPDGMMITRTGYVLVADIEQNWESGTVEYMGNLLLHTGEWNPTLMDVEYELEQIELAQVDNRRPATVRVAASTDGETAWMVSLGTTGDLPPVGGTIEKYNPILFKSTDSGATWSDPIDVQIDGPDGLDGVKNYLSDYRIAQLFTPPLPTRDEIPYTTAFDCDLVVDKWGNPHIGIVVGLAGGDPYSIASGAPGDSTLAVFDIFSDDGGTTWCAVRMGNPWTFRGDFGSLSEDNRVNAAINPAGDRVFITWLDTQTTPPEPANNMPDVFARGYNLMTNMITSVNGEDQPNNVTFLSDVMNAAYFECTSYYTFTSGDGDIIPIVTELLSDPNDPAASVTFKYISDFIYMPDDYTIEAGPCEFPVGVDNRTTLASISVYPNPVTDKAVVKVNMPRHGNVQISMSNMLGQTVMKVDQGYIAAGSQQFTLDTGHLTAGLYFCTVQINSQKYTQKLIVE